MCDVPNNALLCTILDYASLEIDVNCVVTLPHADPSAPITTGTIVTFSRFHNFWVFICRSLYLVIFLAVVLTTLYYCGDVMSINCYVCSVSFQITILCLLNFIIF